MQFWLPRPDGATLALWARVWIFVHPCFLSPYQKVASTQKWQSSSGMPTACRPRQVAAGVVLCWNCVEALHCLC